MTGLRAILCGVDGGGTGTRALVLAGGEARGRGESGPGNPLAAGEEGVRVAVVEAVGEAAREAGIETRAIDVLGFGLAGAEALGPRREGFARSLGEVLGCPRTWIGSDLGAALAGAFGGGPGILLAAGTGSSALGFDGGRVLRAGGWGPALGDEGSARDLLRASARALLALHDGFEQGDLEEPGFLPEGAGIPSWSGAFLESLGLRDPSGLPGRFRQDVPAEALRAALEVLARACSSGEPLARALLDRSVRALASLAEVLRRGLGEGIPIRLHGGMFRLLPGLRSGIEARLGCRFLGPTGGEEAARGAALCAAAHHRFPAGESYLPLCEALEAAFEVRDRRAR